MLDASLALCAETDPEAFFPDNEYHRGQIAQAKAVCKACDISKECLTEALEKGYNHGIWGGLTAFERKRLRNNLPELPFGLKKKVNRNDKGVSK